MHSKNRRLLFLVFFLIRIFFLRFILVFIRAIAAPFTFLEVAFATLVLDFFFLILAHTTPPSLYQDIETYPELNSVTS